MDIIGGLVMLPYYVAMAFFLIGLVAIAAVIVGVVQGVSNEVKKHPRANKDYKQKRLARIIEMHDAGKLTDEEFESIRKELKA